MARLILLLVIYSGQLLAQNQRTTIDSVNSIPYEFVVSNLRQSIKIFSENALAASEAEYDFGEAVASFLLARAYYLNGKYEESTASYLKAAKIFEKINEMKKLSEVIGEFGYQLKRRDLNKAKLYMREAIAITEEFEYDSLQNPLYNNYGVLKEMEGDIDSALYYYNLSLDKATQLNLTIAIPYSLNKIAGVQAMKGDYKNAFELLRKSDEYRNKETGDFGRMENLALYGDIYQQMDEVDSAIFYYSKCLDLAKRGGVNYQIRYCYDQLTKLYNLKGDYKQALKSLNNYVTYKDSVLNEEIRRNIAQLEIDYESEKKDREIAENKFLISERNNQIILLTGGVLLLIIFSAVIYINQKKRREREKKEYELTNKLEKAKLENKISEEKLRISRELHDNIGSQLTFMVSSIDNLIYKEKEKSEKLHKISSFGRETLKELRNAIWALRNDGADLESLIRRVNELIRNINESMTSLNIEVKDNITTHKNLTSIQLLNIFRIIQEALQNTVKYAGASFATVEFNEANNGMEITITDNGKGFDVANTPRSNGIENMKFRCEESNGVFKIKSSNKGTEINCLIN